MLDEGYVVPELLDKTLVIRQLEICQVLAPLSRKH